MAVAGVPLVVSEGVVQVSVMLPYTVGDAATDEVVSTSLLVGVAVLLATWTLPMEVVDSGVDVETASATEDEVDASAATSVDINEEELSVMLLDAVV